MLSRLQTQHLDFVFQQDSAALCRATRVRVYLNRKCHTYWIERQEPVYWPARSPDLTPSGFPLWGNIKAQVYTTPVSSIEELRNEIKFECRRIGPETLEKVWDNLKLRLSSLRKVKGGNIKSSMS